MRATSSGRLSERHLRIDSQHLGAETAEGTVAAGDSAATEAVVRAIHFDDQAGARSEEVADGGAADDLAAERDAELRA
jgi:hypothetical protein